MKAEEEEERNHFHMLYEFEEIPLQQNVLVLVFSYLHELNIFSLCYTKLQINFAIFEKILKIEK